MVTGSWCLGGLLPIITGNHLKVTSQLSPQQAVSLSSLQVQGGIIHNRTGESYSEMLTTATLLCSYLGDQIPGLMQYQQIRSSVIP